MALYIPTVLRSYSLIKQSWPKNQKGFSRIESIILILAFVLLASGFLFYVINTTNLASGQSETAILSGLDLANHPLTVKGTVEGLTNSDKTTLDILRFQVTNTSTLLKKVDLSSDQILFLYINKEKVAGLSRPNWSADWITGHPKILDPGESVLLELNMREAGLAIGPSNDFIIRFIHSATDPTLSIILKTPPKFIQSHLNLQPEIVFLTVEKDDS